MQTLKDLEALLTKVGLPKTAIESELAIEANMPPMTKADILEVCAANGIPTVDHVYFRQLVKWGTITNDDFGRRVFSHRRYARTCFDLGAVAGVIVSSKMDDGLKQFAERTPKLNMRAMRLEHAAQMAS